MARRATAAPEPDETQSLKYEVAALVKRVEALEAARPGRKAKPMIALRQDGVCAVSPDIDSSTCPDSSIFRYQQGCHGTACKAKQHDAYERRKDTKTTVAPPKRAQRKVTKTAPKPVAKAPVKRQPRRLAAVATAG